MEDLGWQDRWRAYRTAGFPPCPPGPTPRGGGGEAIEAHLPLLVCGIYYEGWSPSVKPLQESEMEDFLSHIAAAFRNDPEVDPESVTPAAKVLKRYATSGEHPGRWATSSLRRSARSGQGAN